MPGSRHKTHPPIGQEGTERGGADGANHGGQYTGGKVKCQPASLRIVVGNRGVDKVKFTVYASVLKFIDHQEVEVTETKRRYHADGSAPPDGAIFVFGSNLSGLHYGGAAAAAHETYGAQWGIAVGRTGRCYAIPTVERHVRGALPMVVIRGAVEVFLHHAATHPEDQFFVTRVGCGLAGYKDADIAPLFRDAPLNCSLPDPWREFTG